MAVNSTSYDYFFNPRVVFGPGSTAKLPEIIAGMGDNILILTGVSSFKKSVLRDNLYKDLEKRSVKYFEIEVGGEPTTSIVDESADYYRKRIVNTVVSIGGGSVLDAGKAVSGMIPQQGSVVDYIEGAKRHNGVKVPFIAVPTTSGTGSEATKNAVLTRPAANGLEGFKKSLRHDNLVPDVALIDPLLTIECPPEITAACGMDALTQLIESFVSAESSFLSDAFALKGLELHAGKALFQACTDRPDDINIRSGLAYAAYLSGSSLANAGLGAVHGLAGIIGGAFEIPHGTICASLLSKVTEYNIGKLFSGSDHASSRGLEKYSAAGFTLSGRTPSDIKTGCLLLINYLNELTSSLNIPEISDFRLKKNDIEFIAGKAENKNNPVRLGRDDFLKILSA
jgi:alcohol dehydrogenase class IV